MKRLLVILLLIVPSLTALAQAGVRRATVTAAVSATAVPAGQDAVVAVIIDVKPGFHAQSHKPKDPNLIPLTVTPEKPDVGTIGEAVYPPGQDETYPRLGTLNVYTGKVVFYVPVTIPDDAPPGPALFKGKIRFQICDDKSCFAPETRTWSVGTDVVAKGAAAKANEPELFKAYQPTRGGGRTATAPSATQPTTRPSADAPPPIETGNDSATQGALYWLAVAFGAGILFNVVPCVLPVLPIKVLGFAEVARHNRAKTLSLAAVFGLGIVAVFAVLAVFILVFKQFGWGQQFSNPWFAWGIVLLLLVLAAWMFGWLNVNLPGGVYGFSPRHDTYVGNFEWGVMTAILSTPCTGPLFPPLMLWAQAQPRVVGIGAVMMVGVGMAFPYVALSAFPNLARRFPRVGPWAELFKQMMGFVLLGVAVFFAAGRFLHGAALYWALVPAAAAAALFLVTRTVHNGAGPRGISIASVLGIAMVGGTIAAAATFVSPVNWQPYSDAAIDAARAQGKVVLVKFTANWCLNCQYIERTVFHDKAAAAALEAHNVVCFKADLTDEDAAGWKRLHDLAGGSGIPLTALYLPGYDKPLQLSSVYTTDTLVRTLSRLDAKPVKLSQL
jgi:thiol:disulfide interchange protein DsbD